MIKAGILLPVNGVATTAVGIADLFTKINQLSEQTQPLIAFKFVGFKNKRGVRMECGLSMQPQEDMVSIKKLDWLIIPALGLDLENIIRQNRDLVPVIKEFHNRGTTLISICTGAFLLAETGLLNGKNAVTHWAFYNTFRKSYGLVHLVEDKNIIENDGIYMCGGAGLYTNMVLYLTEKYFGRELAILLSKYTLLDIKRDTGHFAMFDRQKTHGDPGILQIQEYLERHFRENIKLHFLASHFSMSQRSLSRNFKRMTGNTIVEYLQRIRIEEAKKQLESTKHRVFEICLNCGYEDLHHFNKLFKRYVGMTPNTYRKKFS